MDLKDLFKSLIWDSLVKVAIEKLIVAAPFLSWGPLAPIFSFIITKITDVLYEQIIKFIDVEAIVFRDKILEQQYNNHYVNLKTVARDYGELSPEFEKAHEESQKYFSDFVRFNIPVPSSVS